MKYLNLDPQFVPFNQSIIHEAFQFNGGEPHIKILEELSKENEVTITTRIKTFNDIGLLLVAVDALRRMGVQEVCLFIPYFPGARQDRLMVLGEPLTVKVYADLINGLNFKKVTIVDPHSEVTLALLNNVEELTNHHLVKLATDPLKDYFLVSPDGGALKKIYKTAQYLGGVDVVECGKTRDVTTGSLSGFKVHHEDLGGRTCVVVDDICDGGGTFLGLAEELRKHNAGDLILVVTHGIFNRGTEELSKYYSRIVCADSFSNLNDPNIEQVKLKEIIN